MASWYYYQNNQQVGPVEETTIRDLIASRVITHDTLIWGDGMETWQPITTTPLATMLPVAPPSQPMQAQSMQMQPGYAAAPAAMAAGLPAERIKRISLFFTLWWIFAVVGIVLCATIVGIIVGVPILIAAAVFYFIMLYGLWQTVQDGRARTTSGKAIGFLFIPFFNIYWQFVAIWGLSQELNRYAREYNLPAPQASESLALTACILYCCTAIPYLGLLAAIPYCIVLIIAIKNMRDTAIAILQSSNG